MCTVRGGVPPPPQRAKKELLGHMAISAASYCSKFVSLRLFTVHTLLLCLSVLFLYVVVYEVSVSPLAQYFSFKS
jgi:hypothetical protein